MAEQSLKDKTVKGVAWSGIDNIAQYGVSFVVSIVLARLLTPDDYGLIGIIAIFTAICTTLISGGFGAALIRKQETTNEDFSTAFWVNLGMSLLLYLIIFLCSPIIALFFGRSELIVLTRVSSLSIIVIALSMVQQTRLTKCIDFKTQTKVTLVASIASGVVGIVLALCGMGVWALVAQSLSSQIFRTILLWLANKWIPRLQFSKKSFHELFGYGWKLMVSQLLNTIWQDLYQVVVGKFYSPYTLGQYTRAKGFSQLFSKNLTDVIQRVTFPVLSNIQDDRERMVLAYRKIIKVTMFVTAVCMLFLGSISGPLIYCLIGAKWHDAAIYLPFICINASLYPLHAINLNMLQVLGRSDLFLGLEIIKKIIALGPLFIGAFIGILPMLYASIVVGIICYFLNSYYSGKILGYSSWMQLKDIAPSYAVAFIVGFSVYFLKFLPLSNWVILPLQMVIGLSVLLVVCKGTKMNMYEETESLLKPVVRRVIHKREK